jgi:hypothetical protein
MARKPTNPFAPKRAPKPRNPFAPPKPADTPAPRKEGFERTLCGAIRSKLLVELRYEDDIAARVFAPDVVYRSSKGKICTSGRLFNALGTEPHTFEVGKIKTLAVTDRPFTPDPRFNLFDPKYRDRICPI